MTEYPKSTGLYCPSCNTTVVLDEYIQTLPDQDGNPVETTGTAYYCQNRNCDNNTLPITKEELCLDDTV